MTQENGHSLGHTCAAWPLRRYAIAFAATCALAGVVAFAVSMYRACRHARAIECLQEAGFTAYYDYEMLDSG